MGYANCLLGRRRHSAVRRLLVYPDATWRQPGHEEAAFCRRGETAGRRLTARARARV